MTHAEAVDLISSARLTSSPGPATWADLGCGDGTFTLALASLLPAGSTIYAVDRDAATLRSLPDEFHGSRIVHLNAPTSPSNRGRSLDLDGILMANSLHDAPHQSAFVRKCASQLRAHHQVPPRRVANLRRGNPWVPYPLDQSAARQLFRDVGYTSVSLLGTRPSRYQRGSLYSLLATTEFQRRSRSEKIVV